MTEGGESTQEAAQPLEIGDPALVGMHRILGRLGAGAKYVVYLAAAGGGDERVAITMLAPLVQDDVALRSAFRRTAATLTRVAQPGSVRIIEDGTDRDPPFLVSDYVPGAALDDPDGPVPLSPERSFALAVCLAAVLAERHEDGAVHGGVTPKNVLLTRAGPRLVDYGSPCDAVIQIHQHGGVGDTAAWTAPERLNGDAGRAAADVFGWACVAAYASTGRHPFGEGEPTAVAQQILFGEPDLLGVPIQMRAVIRRALSARPEDRPEARELLAQLLPGRTQADLLPEAARTLEAAWADNPSPEAPARTARRTGVRGWPWPVFAVAVVLLVAAGLMMVAQRSGGTRHTPAPTSDAAPQPTATVRVTVTPTLPAGAKKVQKRRPITVPTGSEAPRAAPTPRRPPRARFAHPQRPPGGREAPPWDSGSIKKHPRKPP